MPKVYLSGDDRRKQKIIRTLQGVAKGKQKDLSEVWGITQPAVSQRLKSGNVTLYDLYLARDFLRIDLEDLETLLHERG